MGVWTCVFLWCAMDSKTLSSKQSDPHIQSKQGLCSTGCASGVAESKSLSRQSSFVEPQSEKGLFRLTAPTV